jgi:predicted polyphosphate/ATP-dependent NAD kinase
VALGFVVNPLAGTGGPLALKGSDGLGAEVASGWAAMRGARALAGLTGRGLSVLTAAGAMGEDAARAAGVAAEVVYRPGPVTCGADTAAAVRALVAAGAGLIIFVGGDGTARDVLAATPPGAPLPVPVLAVPAGVKMHSSVFAPSPATAAMVLSDIAAGRRFGRAAAEVLDRDAEGHLQLFGMLPVLAGPPRQAAKAAGAADDDAALAGAVAGVAARLRAEPLCLIGPGLTMLALKTALAGAGTLRGVDVFAHGALLAADASAGRLRDMVRGHKTRLALGVVGGQGYLLGRGNQQLCPAVLDQVAWPPVVLASAAKLAGLPGGRLLVDTGDEALDQRLAGHVEVRTGARRTMVMRIDAA